MTQFGLLHGQDLIGDNIIGTAEMNTNCLSSVKEWYERALSFKGRIEQTMIHIVPALDSTMFEEIWEYTYTRIPSLDIPSLSIPARESKTKRTLKKKTKDAR